MHNNGNVAIRADENITDRLGKFTNLISSENTYRTPVRFLWDIGKVNHPLKLDIRIICSLETDIAKLLSNQQISNIAVPDSQII